MTLTFVFSDVLWRWAAFSCAVLVLAQASDSRWVITDINNSQQLHDKPFAAWPMLVMDGQLFGSIHHSPDLTPILFESN